VGKTKNKNKQTAKLALPARLQSAKLVLLKEEKEKKKRQRRRSNPIQNFRFSEQTCQQHL
jgi:hypothetical protein